MFDVAGFLKDSMRFKLVLARSLGYLCDKHCLIVVFSDAKTGAIDTIVTLCTIDDYAKDGGPEVV